MTCPFKVGDTVEVVNCPTITSPAWGERAKVISIVSDALVQVKFQSSMRICVMDVNDLTFVVSINGLSNVPCSNCGHPNCPGCATAQAIPNTAVGKMPQAWTLDYLTACNCTGSPGKSLYVITRAGKILAEQNFLVNNCPFCHAKIPDLYTRGDKCYVLLSGTISTTIFDMLNGNTETISDALVNQVKTGNGLDLYEAIDYIMIGLWLNRQSLKQPSYASAMYSHLTGAGKLEEVEDAMNRDCFKRKDPRTNGTNETCYFCGCKTEVLFQTSRFCRRCKR